VLFCVAVILIFSVGVCLSNLACVHDVNQPGDKRRSSTSLNDVLRFKPLRGVADQTRLTLDSRGVRYNNRQSSPGVDGRATDNLEVRTKNAIYCALIFKEFIKELAAISQEHLLIQAESLSSTSEHWFQH
jgi:KELAA motif